MDLDDLAPRKKPPAIQLGEDISALSAHELEARIARLEEEIARCKNAIAATLKNARSSSKHLIFKPISRILVNNRRSTTIVDSWRRTHVRANV